MKTVEVKLCTYDELSEEAKEVVYQDWFKGACEWEPYLAYEIIDSLKALFNELRIKLFDWSLGRYQHNYIRFGMDDDVAELSGKRAMAWLENNLYDHHRISPADYIKNRKTWHGYGYRIGRLKDCFLTGVCYDEDFIQALNEAVRDGQTLKDALRGLADVAGNAIATESDYQISQENFRACMDISEDVYLENGKLFDKLG